MWKSKKFTAPYYLIPSAIYKLISKNNQDGIQDNADNIYIWPKIHFQEGEHNLLPCEKNVPPIHHQMAERISHHMTSPLLMNTLQVTVIITKSLIHPSCCCQWLFKNSQITPFAFQHQKKHPLYHQISLFSTQQEISKRKSCCLKKIWEEKESCFWYNCYDTCTK